MGPKKGKKDLKNHEDDRGKRLAKKITDLNKEDKNSEGAKKDKTKKKKTSFTLPEKGDSNKSGQDSLKLETKEVKKSKKNQANERKDLRNIEHNPAKAKEVSKKKPKESKSKSLKNFVIEPKVSNPKNPGYFMIDPIQDKLVTTMPGIKELVGWRLTGKGYDKAYVLLGQYLVCKKNRDLFIDWLMDYAGATENDATDCHEALRDWCEIFL